MDSGSFSEIVLTGSEARILKKLSHGASVPFDEDNDIHMALDSLYLIESIGLSGVDSSGHSCGVPVVTASEKGKRYMIYRKEDRFRHRWPVYLSIAAAVIALAALIKSFFF